MEQLYLILKTHQNLEASNREQAKQLRKTLSENNLLHQARLEMTKQLKSISNGNMNRLTRHRIY